jgi:hypothetical protein
MPDQWEREQGFDPSVDEDKDEDADGDGLSNAGEYEAGTNPNNPDSDGDGYPDGWELTNSFYPQDDSDGGPVYVSVTGNDGNKGTQGSPYLTLAKAVGKAKAGLDEARRTVYVVGELSEASGNDPVIQGAIFAITDTGKNGVTISGIGTDVALKRATTLRRSILYLGPDTRLTLKNITITGGNNDKAGGIFVDSGELTLDISSVITNNRSFGSLGGGILVENGKLTMLNNARISNNTGGGVYLLGSEFFMDGGAITGNTALNGGGLYLTSRSKAVLKGDAEISGNSTLPIADGGGSGGGILVLGQSELILEENVKIIKNTSEVASGVGIADVSSFIMRGGEISENIGRGVGVSWFSTFTMEGGRIAENVAADIGGGVFLLNMGSFTMTGGVIEKNSAKQGGAIHMRYDLENPNPFTMTGGVIYGSDNAEKGNTATAANGGHVLFHASSPAVTVDTTITRYPLP